MTVLVVFFFWSDRYDLPVTCFRVRIRAGEHGRIRKDFDCVRQQLKKKSESTK